MIAICTPVWGRPKLTAKVLRRWSLAKVNRRLAIFAGTSERGRHEMHGATQVLVQNNPLGAKFNELISMAGLCKKFQGVMVCGSDNLIHEDYLDWIDENKPSFSALGQCYYYNSVTGEMVRHWQGLPGAGKYMSAEFLDRCDWRPYDDKKNLNVDGGPERYATPNERIVVGQPQGPWVIDVKSSEGNLWGWDSIMGYGCLEKANAEQVFAEFGEYESSWRE